MREDGRRAPPSVKHDSSSDEQEFHCGKHARKRDLGAAASAIAGQSMITTDSFELTQSKRRKHRRGEGRNVHKEYGSVEDHPHVADISDRLTMLQDNDLNQKSSRNIKVKNEADSDGSSPFQQSPKKSPKLPVLSP